MASSFFREYPKIERCISPGWLDVKIRVSMTCVSRPSPELPVWERVPSLWDRAEKCVRFATIDAPRIEVVQDERTRPAQSMWEGRSHTGSYVVASIGSASLFPNPDSHGTICIGGPTAYAYGTRRRWSPEVRALNSTGPVNSIAGAGSRRVKKRRHHVHCHVPATPHAFPLRLPFRGARPKPPPLCPCDLLVIGHHHRICSACQPGDGCHQPAKRIPHRPAGARHPETPPVLGGGVGHPRRQADLLADPRRLDGRGTRCRQGRPVGQWRNQGR